MTKKILLAACLAMLATAIQAQKNFRAYLYNNEYNVYLRINFYDQDISVPGQDLYGKLPGYLGKKYNSFCWVITDCEEKDEQHAEMQLINDFGSEDLTATLTWLNDSTYELKQGAGSTIKVPNKGKWQKLPKTLILKKDPKR